MAVPLTPAETTAHNALIVSTISAVVSGGSLGIAIWNTIWTRRPSWAKWEIDEGYKIDLERDRSRFAYAFTLQIPREGDSAILIKFRYHGRFSAKVVGFTYDWNFKPYARVTVEPRVVNDGETWEGLIFHNDVNMDQITAVTVFCEGGQTFTSRINLDYREVIDMHTGEHK